MEFIKKNQFYLILILEIIVILLIVLGIVPREAILGILGIFVFFIIFSTLEDGVMLFVSSIPLFVALPISESFDSLSFARIIILILFFKWLLCRKQIKFGKIEILSILLFFIMVLSIFFAVDKMVAIKRIIYLVNLGVVAILVSSVVKNNETFKKISKAILISGGIVFLIALAQLIGVYFVTIGGFWDWWAGHVSYNFYGQNLFEIVKTNNAWFASSPSSSSVLRVFGSFTDPHSFSLYLLLVIPFMLVYAIPFMQKKIREGKFFKQHILWLIWILLSLFFIILSGTRGIWVGAVFAIFTGIYCLLKRVNYNQIVSWIIILIIIFILLIPIASVFTAIPQFKESGGNDAALVLKRLASILNLDEISNQGRVYIWKRSLESIKKHPLIGVGMGNFPIVLEQDIALAKAGSSAHNLYLNFLTESGIFAVILIVLILLEILSIIFKVLKQQISLEKRKLFTAMFIFLVWVFGYSLFDIALMDERVFLLFLTILGMILAIKRNSKILENG